MSFQITVSGFADGGTIPQRHTCEGQDLSPALDWAGAPAGAKSFVLIVDDPDAPVGTWNHWLLYDLPATTESLAEAARPPAPARSGRNDFGRLGYGGPCPPRGHGPHRYYFRLYAVEVASLGLPEGVSRADLDRALRPHVLAETQYLGRYERR